MRCPSCGTENAPDSRFCGGCGARLNATGSRLAPTHKITDDAPYPQHVSQPPVHVPMSMPPPVALGRASTDPMEPPRPVAKRLPTPVPQHAPQISSAAMPRHGRRWGLVIAILVIDAGLATAGSMLLMQGLNDTKPAPGAEPVKTSEVSAGSAGSAAAPAATPTPVAMRIEKAKVKPRVAPPPPLLPPPPTKTKPVKKGKAAPVDPYAGSDSGAAPAAVPPSQDDEDHSAAISDAIDAKSSHAEGVFSRCYTQATKSLPADQALKGRIMISFTVLANGHVGNVATAENQTGSDQLANCLGSEIGGWIFNEHPQDPIEITKIFAFGPSSS